jgi:hypothetical protein
MFQERERYEVSEIYIKRKGVLFLFPELSRAGGERQTDTPRPLRRPARRGPYEDPRAATPKRTHASA